MAAHDPAPHRPLPVSTDRLNWAIMYARFRPTADPVRVLAIGVVMTLYSLSAPAAPPAFSACIDYACDERREVSLRAQDWRQISNLFAGVHGAAAERNSISQAIASMEQLVGAQTGTWQDLDQNSADNGGPGQLDCIAESINSTTYLRLLEQTGLLRWHTVEERVRRQRWLVAIHWTAVIRDTDTQQLYAVDSWYGDNGAPAQVQPLADWRQGLYPPLR